MVADKLVELCLRDGCFQWILVHIEVQAQRDASLPRRVFDYNYRISTQYGQPVLSLVLLADDDPKWHPHAYHRQVEGSVTDFSFDTAKLLDYAKRSDELLASHNPFAWITLAHLQTQQARHDADALYAAKWHLTKLLYQHGWHRQRIALLFKVIDWMMALPDPLQERYWQAVLQLEKERKMEFLSPFELKALDKGMKKGLEQGLEQGLKQGRKEGTAALLARLLTRRFGPLPKTVHNRLAAASVAQLEIWSDALAEAESLKQVFVPKTLQ